MTAPHATDPPVPAWAAQPARGHRAGPLRPSGARSGPAGWRAGWPILWTALLVALLPARTIGAEPGTGSGAATAASVATAPPWAVAYRLGLMQFVVLPADAGQPDEAAYQAQADQLCGEVPTCFLRFFANPRGLALAMPLPDEILTAPTARYSRSGKRGAAVFEWSCRIAPTEGACF